jgi:hypothetical protein
MLRRNVSTATGNLRGASSRVTFAKRLELMRSASSLCVQSVVNHASLAEDFGTLPVSVCTVLELTRPSLTCKSIRITSHGKCGVFNRLLRVMLLRMRAEMQW